MKQQVLGRESQLQHTESPELANLPFGTNIIIGQTDDSHHLSTLIALAHESNGNQKDAYNLSGLCCSKHLAEKIQTALHQWTEASSKNDNGASLNDQAEPVNDLEDARFQDGAMFLQEDTAENNIDDDKSNGDDHEYDKENGLVDFSPGEEGHKGVATSDLLREGFLQKVLVLGMD